MKVCKIYPFFTTIFFIIFLSISYSESQESNDSKESDKVAQELSESEGGLGWFKLLMPGYYRIRGNTIPDIQLDNNGDELPENSWGTHRIRFEPEIRLFNMLSLKSQIDVLDGLIYGEEEGREALGFSDMPRDEVAGFDFKTFWVNRYWAEIKTKYALVEGGRMPSKWGLGILANDGNGFDDEFGDNFFGDTVDRIALITKPISLFSKGSFAQNLYSIFAYDTVYQDAIANEDDSAIDYLVASLYRSEPITLGLYTVWRSQLFEERDTNANVYDGFVNLKIKPGFMNGNLFLKGEFVYLDGTSDLQVDAEVTPPREAEIKQYGFNVKGGAEFEKIDIAIEGGYATPEDNPFDNKVKNFSFHPDYNVGLILFEELIASLSATSASNLADPELVANPPEGITLLPTNGSFTSAWFLMPTLKYRPIKGLQTTLGVLYARAPEGLIDPYNSIINAGGVPVNYFGGELEKELGWEVDGGMKYTFDWKPIDMELGVQGGYLWPGNAFDDVEGDSLDELYTVQGRMTFIW